MFKRIVLGAMALALVTSCTHEKENEVEIERELPQEPLTDTQPNLLVALGNNNLGFWKFHVDWATPTNSAVAISALALRPGTARSSAMATTP